MLCFTGTTSALEDGHAWTVSYHVMVDPMSWATRSACVSARTDAGKRALEVRTDGRGGWWLDGRRAGHLDGCLDIDLESSVLTNAFPVRRLGLASGQGADAPGAYVRAEDLRVERLEQRYMSASRTRMRVDGLPMPRRRLTSRACWPTTTPASCSTIQASRSGPRDRAIPRQEPSRTQGWPMRRRGRGPTSSRGRLRTVSSGIGLRDRPAERAPRKARRRCTRDARAAPGGHDRAYRRPSRCTSGSRPGRPVESPRVTGRQRDRLKPGQLAWC